MVPVFVRRALADGLGDGAGASPTGGVP
jgi:hypothetical protein